MPGTIWEQVVFELQSPELHEHADARRVADELWSEGARVGANFFETVGIPLAAGRTFSAAEIRQGAPVAIVDETFVRIVLGGRSPFGVRLRQRAEKAGQEPGPWLEIVGVVKDATTMPRKGPDDAALYRPAAPAQPVRLLVRTHGAASPMPQRIYAAARSVHPDIRLADLKSLVQVAYDDALPERIFLRAFIVVGAIALLLATAGIYALISFTLARRTREIGIRVALGASPRRIITVVFARAFMQIGLGVAAGFLPGLVIMVSGSDDAGAMNTCGRRKSDAGGMRVRRARRAGFVHRAAQARAAYSAHRRAQGVTTPRLRRAPPGGLAPMPTQSCVHRSGQRIEQVESIVRIEAVSRRQRRP